MNKTDQSGSDNSQFYEIIEGFADPIVFLDARRVIRYVNKAFMDLFQFDYQEVITRDISAFLPDDGNCDTEKSLDTVLAFPGTVASFEVQFRNSRQSWLYLDVSAKNLCNQLRQPMIVLHLKDVTGRKLAEVEREKLRMQLNQAQKLESIGRLAGGVAHDFNNMLGVILGHAELLADKLPPDSPVHADLSQIMAAGHRSADLTRQLLAFARKQIAAPKLLDLNQATESLLKMLKRLIGEDVDLLWRPAASLEPVLMDSSQIDQVLVNLCVNARDAIANNGKITIETGTVVFDDQYCAAHLGFSPGKFALLAVSDNGCGMDKETQVQIFEPFFTTKESGKGTGLGLSTVFGIVKQNDGFINVYSEPGEGTTFRIYLPCYAARATRAALREDEPLLHGRGTILLVEDEPAILEMTRQSLEGFGYCVLTASTPSAAIKMARGHAGEIELLITDVVLPEMNGRDLSLSLLRIYPNLKRLFISGYTADVIVHHGVLDLGVQFLQKPFSMRDLSAKVSELLEKSPAAPEAAEGPHSPLHSA
jgi:PAS domain S-box-containing protein